MKNLIALAAVAALVGCESSNEDAHKLSDSASDASMYAMNAVQYSWPENIGNVARVARNVLAPNYYIVFDGSGSMEEQGCSGGLDKVVVAKRSVNLFVDKLPENANVGLFVFDLHGTREVVALGQDRARVKNEINNINASGGTPLRRAVEAAYDALTTQARVQLGYGEYHLIVVTDGEANSGQDPEAAVMRALRLSPVQVHTIGFCIGKGHSLNIPGKTYYAAANNPAELDAGLSSVLAEAPDFQVGEFAADNTP